MIEAFLLVAALLLIVAAGLLSAIDAALAVTSTAELIDLASEGRSARALAQIADDRDAHDNATTLLRVMCEVAATVFAAVAFVLLTDSRLWGAIIAIAVMALVVYTVVASATLAVGRRHAEGLLAAAAPSVHAARVVLGPVAGGLTRIGSVVIPGARRRGFESEDQLLSIVDEAASNDLIEDDDRELIHSVFDFTDQVVRGVMVPRTEMVTVEATATLPDALEELLSSGLSRVPVIDGDVDDVVGVLYLKDIVQHTFRESPGWRDAPVRAYARPAVFVPEQMRAETLLQQMKADQVHVCLVVDEYGGIAGLVTMEDLLEELVGEIADEYDPRSTEIVELADGSYRVSAGLALDEVGDLFGIDIEDEDVDSIGGLLAKLLGHVPQPGEKVEAEGLVLTGGTSRGRGRGIATVFVDRGAAMRAVAEVEHERPATGSLSTAPRVDAVPDPGAAKKKKKKRKPRADD
ncbi:hemolysin family protein [Microbacterium indicum]|uniref:hemolysin family protein n=1 Tax=Microbacterium indicum TaxID=358100 RepID=UPI000405038E|nr:hemolysin family protein [Microbacterium indicum]